MKATEETKPEKLLNVDEIAEILGVDKEYIYKRTMHGQKGIPHIKVGKYLRFEREVVLNFFKDQTGDAVI